MATQKSNKKVIIEKGKVFMKEMPADKPKAKRKTTPGLMVKGNKVFRVDIPVKDELPPEVAQQLKLPPAVVEKLDIDRENYMDGLALFNGFEKTLTKLKLDSSQKTALMVCMALDYGRKNPQSALDEAVTP